MPYDANLAQRINTVLGDRKGFVKKKMFGGIGFLLNGNMCCGVHRDNLILRLDPKVVEVSLAEERTKPFDITGKVMKGWMMVTPPGLTDEAKLKRWIDLAVRFVETLPAK